MSIGLFYNFQKWLAGPANLEVKFLEHNWISVLLPQSPYPRFPQSFNKIIAKQTTTQTCTKILKQCVIL